MESVPKVLDWVRARADCSIERVFTFLTEVLKSDVESIQARSSNDVKFAFETPTDTTVVVSRTGTMGTPGFVEPPEAVVFERRAAGIVARTKAGDLFTAKPTLAMNGQCRLEIEGELFELWQVSRKALEPLFF